MRKPVTPFAHGILDYATSGAVVAAPRLLGFPTAAAKACYALAASYTSLSMVTDYPLALKKLVPFKTHGVTECVIGAVLPAVPWMLGFGRHTAARNFFIGLAVLTAVVAAATDWNKE
jgi:hypothetical protein